MITQAETAPYNLAAVGRRWLSHPDARIFWTKFVIALGFLSGFLLSRKLWVSTRFFPLTPVIHKLPRIPYPVDYIYFAALLVLLVVIALSPKPRIYIFIFVPLILFLALLDQSRWQPWAYQYLFMLAALGFFSWKSDDAQGRDDALNICRLIIVTIYIYSGLQKINPHFVANVFPALVDTIGKRAAALHVLGWGAPFAEIGIGVGLLTKRFRNIAVLAGVTMHWFILVALGPFGRNWNAVVWPWNLAMITFLFLLFWKTDFSFRDVLWRNRFRFQKVVLILFGIMPFFSFFGWWDSYLSSSLYSGNVTLANIFVSEAVKNELPGYIRGYVQPLAGSNHVLKIADWSVGELNVPPYPEMRIYKSVGADICSLTNNSPDVALYVKEKGTLQGGNRETRYTCFGTLVVHGW